MNFWSSIGKVFLPSLVWKKEEEEKVVYLTFDDGPHPTLTNWVMDLLDQYDAKGTFFLVGENILKYPAVVEKLTGENHAIGNHTQHHVKGWGTPKKRYLEEIETCAQALGHKRLFRPPFGQINLRALKEITSEYEVIMWDIIAWDFLPTLDKKRALKRIKNDTRPGSIIVFHDSAKAEDNLRALLPEYLKFLQENGYIMKAL